MSLKSKIKKFHKLLESTKSDNERFAVLLLITKSIDIQMLEDGDKSDIFNAIGLQFPQRMMITAVNNQDSNSLPLASLGVSVFSSFYDKMLTKDQLSILANVIEVCEKCSAGKFDNYSESELTLLTDCNQLWHILVADLAKKNVANIDELKLSFIKQICSACKSTEFKFSNSSICILTEHLNMFAYSTNELIEMLQDLLTHLSTQIYNDKSEGKFTLMKSTTNLINNLSEEAKSILLSDECNKNFSESLTQVLSSKLSVFHRHTGLIFANSLISKCGFEYFLKNRNDKKFIRLIVRLSCIEAKIWLENNFDENLIQVEDELMVASWCNIIEEACSKIVKFENDDDSFFDFEDIKSLQPALEDVATVNGMLISSKLSSSSDMAFSNICILEALIKLLCSWLCVENHVYSEAGFQIIPTLCQIINHIIISSDFQLIKYTLSPLMLLIEDAGSLTHLLDDEKLIELLHKLFMALSTDVDSNRVDLESLMQCVYGILTTANARSVNINDISREYIESFYKDVSSSCGKLDSSYWYMHLLHLVLHNLMSQNSCDEELKSSIKKLKKEIRSLSSLRSESDTTIEVLIKEQLEKLKSMSVK